MNLPRPHQIEVEEAIALGGRFTVRPKLDGIRAYSDGEKWIGKDGQTLDIDLPLSPAGCDGELWAPGLSFCEILSIFRKGGEGLQHWVFDGPESEFTVPSVTIDSSKIGSHHQENLDRGYEGSVITGVETGAFYKIKPVLDFEAEMIDYEGMSGTFRPLPNPSGETPDGEFKCRVGGGVFPQDVVTIICNGLTKNGKPRHARIK